MSNQNKFHNQATKVGMQRAIEQGIHVGRPRGSFEDESRLLAKYPQVVELLRQDMSLRGISYETDIAVNTIRKTVNAIETYRNAQINNIHRLVEEEKFIHLNDDWSIKFQLRKSGIWDWSILNYVAELNQHLPIRVPEYKFNGDICFDFSNALIQAKQQAAYCIQNENIYRAGVVYFLRLDGDFPIYKIGFSRNLPDRINSLQRRWKRKLTVIHKIFTGYPSIIEDAIQSSLKLQHVPFDMEEQWDGSREWYFLSWMDLVFFQQINSAENSLWTELETFAPSGIQFEYDIIKRYIEEHYKPIRGRANKNYKRLNSQPQSIIINM